MKGANASQVLIHMYDTIIIGGGPAGLAAAIYAVRRELKTLLITKHLGGQMIWASVIENYPAIKSATGPELSDRMAEQVKNLGTEIKLAEVKKIEKTADGNFLVATGKENFSAKTAIIATGAEHRHLGVPGEEKLIGRGVAFCANCDGPLFRDKIVAVVGGGNSALDAAEVLSKIAREVYLIHQFNEFQAFEAFVKKVLAAPNIKPIMGGKVEEVLGGNRLEKIKIKKQNDGALLEIAVNGLFVEIGLEIKTGLVEGLAERNKQKEVIINEKSETSMPGLFAAGDCASTAFKQITVAAGAGTTAALSAYRYIQTKEGHLEKLLK